MAVGAGPLVNLDKLTYAGNRANLASVEGAAGYTFVEGDICDAALVARLLDEHRPRAHRRDIQRGRRKSADEYASRADAMRAAGRAGA